MINEDHLKIAHHSSVLGTKLYSKAPMDTHWTECPQGVPRLKFIFEHIKEGDSLKVTYLNEEIAVAHCCNLENYK